MRLSVWLLLIMTFTLSLACFAERAPANTSGKSANEIKNWMIVTSQIGEGKVELLEGPESCQSGTLRVLELEDEVTLMLGAHPLVVGIGKTAIVEDERDCKSRETATVSARKIQGDRFLNCHGELTEYHVVVEPIDKGIRYTRKVVSAGKKSREEACKYKYVN